LNAVGTRDESTVPAEDIHIRLPTLFLMLYATSAIRE
jgi:hypothetical protein